MNHNQRQFLEQVSRATSQHFALERQSETTYEAEVAVLCAIVGTMTGFHDRAHTNLVLDCLHAYVMRMRAGNEGALQLAIIRLANLQQQRLCAIGATL